MQVCDLDTDRVVAGRCTGRTAHSCQSSVDDCGIRFSKEHVVATRPVFLEVSRFMHLDKSFLEVGAVQRVCLEPLFSPGFSCSAWMCDHVKQPGHEILHHYLAGEW